MGQSCSSDVVTATNFRVRGSMIPPIAPPPGSPLQVVLVVCLIFRPMPNKDEALKLFSSCHGYIACYSRAEERGVGAGRNWQV